jgi:hypothetical protein
MVESKLGEIPEGWEVGSIGDIALAKGGAFFSTCVLPVGCFLLY